jgi:hypothetical protein
LQIYTSKYLSTSDRTSAKLAYNHMGVFLNTLGGIASRFKIMPRFKIRGEGDPVQAGDHCLLLSENAAGKFQPTIPHSGF